jgi:lysophospholipase L1-like esterase
VTDAGKPYNVRVADGFGELKKAARQAHGNSCTANLLTALSGADKGTCGVHPSVAGQALLAQAVERAIKK